VKKKDSSSISAGSRYWRRAAAVDRGRARGGEPRLADRVGSSVVVFRNLAPRDFGSGPRVRGDDPRPSDEASLKVLGVDGEVAGAR
jgi:hypothetical protein